MQLNKDRLPGARRLKVLEAKERTQQVQQEAKQAFANYQAAQTGPVIPGGQQGIGLPPDESVLNVMPAEFEQAIFTCIARSIAESFDESLITNETR